MAISYLASRGQSVLSNPVGSQSGNNKNTGGVLGGLGYLFEKNLASIFEIHEGAADYTFAGLAKLFGRDDWAEWIIANDWFGDWYTHADRWYNPGQGWKVAGDVASGLGTSAPGMGVNLIVSYFSGSKALGATASAFAVGLGAAGRATKEAYEQTGQLTGKEFGYGALSGLSEGAIEGVTNLLDMGGGAVVKNVVKALGKETGEVFAKEGIKTLASSFFGEAFEEGLSEYLDPYLKRMTYDPNAKNATTEEILYAGLVGGLSGLVSGGSTYAIDGATSFLKGNKIALNGGAAEVIETSGYLSAFEEKNHTSDELLSEISSVRKHLIDSLQKTDGNVVTADQKKILGALSRANIAATSRLFVAREAQNIVNNAETIAKRLTSYGYKTAEGKPITFTASEITQEYDPKNPSSIFTALEKNDKLRSLAVASSTGRLMMDSNKFAKATLMGEKLASQVDINRFYEQASAAEIRDVSKALKIDSWSGLTAESFNQKIADFISEGGAEKAVKNNEIKAAFAALTQDAIPSVPKYANIGQDTMVRYSDGMLDLGVERRGDSYRTYNYKTGDLSKELTGKELNSFLRDYSARRDEYAAAERERMEAEQKRKNEIAEIDNLARENIKEYKSLNAPNQSMIRQLIRDGRAQGVSDSDVLTYAKISAHSGIDIVFSKEANRLDASSTDGEKYGDGFYDWQNNRIVVNPESKRSAERLLIHELDHAVRGYFGKDGNRMTTVFKEAIEGVDQATRDKIVREYKKIALPGELASTVMDETNAYYAEKVLTNKNTLERIVEAEPGLKDKILTFFKGAESDYADTPKLSGSAKWYYKKFKKMFDEFSARNAQSNSSENAHLSTLSAENAQKTTLTSMKQENMSVSDRQYAIFYPSYSDNDIKVNKSSLANMESVANIGVEKLEKTGIAPKKTFTDYFESLGNNIYSPEFGDIELSNASVKSEIRHGLTSEKIASMEAIPSIIEKGKVIFHKNKGERSSNVERIVVAAPIKIGTEEYYMGVMLQRDSNSQRLYLHNVASIRKETRTTSRADSLTNWTGEEDSRLFITSILQDAINVKVNGENSSDKQFALDIDSERENISGAEIMGWINNKTEGDVASSVVPNADKKRISFTGSERALENEKARIKADYTTDKVFTQVSVKRGFEKVEAVKKIPGKARDEISRDLWLDLEASDSDDTRNGLILEYSAKMYQAIRGTEQSEMTAAQRDALQTELRNAVSEIVSTGRDSKWQKQKDNVRGIVRLEERVGAEYKSKIYQNLGKIKDKKYRRFTEASAYKGDVFKGSIDELTKIDWRGKFSSNIARKEIKRLSEWYTTDNPMFKLEKTGDENGKARLSTNYSETIRYMIDSLSEGDGNLNNTELRMLSDVTEYFSKLVDEYDKVYVEGKWQEGEPIAREMIDTIKKQETVGVPIVMRALRNNITSAGFRTYGDPLSVIKAADMYENGIHTKFYNEWTRGEVNADAEALRIKTKYDDFMKKERTYLKDAEKTTVELHGKQVRKIDLISYAMTLKRKQAWESIAEGGVVFQRYENGLFGNQRAAEDIKIYPTAQIEKGQGYQARLEQAMNAEYEKVMNLLDERDVRYMKVLEEGFELARETKALGDMQRLGFVSVIDGYYYPIKHIDTGHLSELDLELIATDRYANASFNKQTTEGAKSGIRITSADSTFNSHVKGVSRYLYLSPVMDSFNKLYKLQISKNAEVNAENVIKADGRDSMTTIQRTIAKSKTAWRDGKSGNLVGFEYLQNMMLDTMGMGKNVGDDFFSNIRGGSVGFALGANPKVLVTQLSSLISSTNVLSWGSHVGAIGIWSGGMDNYSDVARLRNSDYTIAKAEGITDSVSRFSKTFSSLIGVMDRFVVYRSWAAAQTEVARKGGAAVGTEENRIEAGKLLDKVILETQQNSLSSRRTEGARRGNILVKSMQMYKSDAITGFGRVVDGWGEMNYVGALLKNKNLSDAESKTLKDRYQKAAQGFGKAVGSLTAQAVFMLVVNEVFRNFYGKNDDETEEEKKTRMLIDFGGNLLGGIPIISEIYSAFTSQYGFEPTEMSAVNDFIDTLKDVADYAEKSINGKATDRDTKQMIRTVLYSGGQLLGVPLRNIRNLMYGAVRLFDKDAAYKWDNAVYKKNYSADLAKAIEADDIERAMMIMELAFGEKIGSGLSELSIRELTSLIANGENVIPSAISDTITIGGEEYVLDGEQYAAVKQAYSGVIVAVNSLVDSKVYKSYTAEQKAKVLRKLYSTYKDIAYDRVLGTQRNVMANLVSSLLSEDTFNYYIALSAIEGDVDKNGNTISGSKRAKVVKAIGTLGVSVEERLLLITASGYALKDDDVRGLSAEGAKRRLLKYILTYKGLDSNERLALAQMCGFEVKNGRIVNNFSKNLKKLSKK